MKNSINKGRAIPEMLNGILCKRQITIKNKLQIYNSIVEKWKFNKNLDVDGN
jgi:hypothetical protein